MTVTTRFTLTRRELLSAGAIALVGAACTKGTTPPPPQPSPSPGSIDRLKVGAIELSLLEAQSELTTGKNLFSFGLTTQQGQLLLGGSPKVYASQNSAASGALGPWDATAYKFAADDVFKDNAPRSPLTGFYVAEVDMPKAGNWTFAAVARLSSKTGVGVGIMKVVAKASVAPIGSKAISTPTPASESDACNPMRLTSRQSRRRDRARLEPARRWPLLATVRRDTGPLSYVATRRPGSHWPRPRAPAG